MDGLNVHIRQIATAYAMVKYRRRARPQTVKSPRG